MTYRLGIIAICISILFSVKQVRAQARKVSIIGRVYDADTHQALFRASVQNISTGEGTLTDSTGAFRISASDYNHIVISYLGYRADTSRVNGLYLRQRLDIALHKNKYSIAPVEIIGQRIDYGRDSAERNYWFADALGQQKTRGLDAVEHPISALYDALSGRQKRLWRFQKDYKEFEKRKYIASRVRPGQIQQLFGLKADSLKAFMIWYNPSYAFVRSATDYQLLEDIKHSVALFRQVYKKNPALLPEQDEDSSQ
ncbi:MAG TPA: carboxypeptidase-like regulatory domain-containing protein [Chitinophagaceae bacterium]|nr:carboxypeptidase-like regulatory domain-containing protein [Chitinophagaceae bacterium]